MFVFIIILKLIFYLQLKYVLKTILYMFILIYCDHYLVYIMYSVQLYQNKK